MGFLFFNEKTVLLFGKKRHYSAAINIICLKVPEIPA